MPKRTICILTLLLLVCSSQASTAVFATKRLANLAGYLSLQSLDTLNAGINESYSYKNRPLSIRVNQWGEIEHIGLKLFSQNQRNSFPLPIYDFLERHLLERNVSPTDSEEGTRMQWDKVYFSVGSSATALKIDSTAEFLENHFDLKVYRVTWIVNEEIILQLSFDMDYQLMSGCTEIELEKKFMLNLSRYEAGFYTNHRLIIFPSEGDEFIRQGDFFISPLIRNEMYYTKKSGKWKLVRSEKRLSHSIANMMLDANLDEQVRLDIVMDQYGYKKDSLCTTYRQFIQICIHEGCMPYYGLKEKKDDLYSSTVFLVNWQGGYLHMLSAEIPKSIIDKPKDSVIKGKLYTYIPLFNVSDKILNPQNYKSVNKHYD